MYLYLNITISISILFIVLYLSLFTQHLLKKKNSCRLCEVSNIFFYFQIYLRIEITITIAITH